MRHSSFVQKLRHADLHQWPAIVEQEGVEHKDFLLDPELRQLWCGRKSISCESLAFVLDGITPPKTREAAHQWCQQHQVEPQWLLSSTHPTWVSWGVQLSTPSQDPSFVHNNLIMEAYSWGVEKVQILVADPLWRAELRKADLSRLFNQFPLPSTIYDVAHVLADSQALSDKAMCWGLEGSLIHCDAKLFSLLHPNASPDVWKSVMSFSWVCDYVVVDANRSTQLLLNAFPHRAQWNWDDVAHRLASEHTSHMLNLNRADIPPLHGLHHYSVVQVIGQLVTHDCIAPHTALRHVFSSFIPSSRVSAETCKEWLNTYLTEAQQQEIFETVLPKMKNFFSSIHHPKLDLIFERHALRHEVGQHGKPSAARKM